MGAAAAAAAGLAAAQGPAGGYGYGSDMGYGKLNACDHSWFSTHFYQPHLSLLQMRLLYVTILLNSPSLLQVAVLHLRLGGLPMVLVDLRG